MARRRPHDLPPLRLAVGLVSTLALLLGGVLGWFAGNRSADAGEDVLTANTELIAEWTDAVRGRDAARISDLYTMDAVLSDAHFERLDVAVPAAEASTSPI